MQESESQEDQYLFEICPVKHSVQNCHQNAISCVSSVSKPVYSLSQLEVLKNHVVCDWKGHASQNLQSSKMPRLTKIAKASASVTEKIQDESSAHEESASSDQEQDPEVIIQSLRAQIVPNMFMPCTEGPIMDWTVNDGLYHRFLKFCLKCENILECELAMLPEKGQCKKVIAWSSDFSMDQYVSWNLSTDELMLDTIWERFEEFCKPQSNEVRARFDLLIGFQHGIKLVDEWYNAVQTKVALAKYPPETAKIFHRDIFWFFLKDEELVSKTINDSNIDLDKFPASKVRQLAKNMESSKVTVRHIK